MLIQDILSSEQAIPAASAETRERRNDPESTPASWGADTVSISPEAREAQRAQQALQPEAEQGDGSEAEQDPLGVFHSFLDKAKGQSAASGSPKEQIKALQQKLVSLQSKLAQIASSNMPEEAKGSQISTINGQINAIMNQISELAAQAAAEESGAA